MTIVSRLVNSIVFICLASFLSGQTQDTIVLVSPDSIIFTQTIRAKKLPKPNKVLEGYDNYDDYFKALKLSEKDTSFKLGERDTIIWRRNGFKTFFNIENEVFVVNERGDINKYCSNKLCAGFGFDLGYMWYVNKVKYFLMDEKIIFIYSITEDYEKKTFIASFNRSNLLSVRKTYIKGYHNPIGGKLDGDYLTLYYSENETVKINLKKDLERKDKETEREAIKRFNLKQ